MTDRNRLGQPIGDALSGWTARARPARLPMEGDFCILEPLRRDRHLATLFAAFGEDREDRIWTYLPYGPFAGESALGAWIDEAAAGEDPLFFAIVERRSGRALGVASYLRIAPESGSIEVGHINYAPALQRTAAATEAMYLMMRRVFGELGYRRYEWKCDALNDASRQAAERLGFRFEGVFRQATVYKQRNRDTAWFSVIDREWPVLERGYAVWLDPANFDAAGNQRRGLGDCIREARDGG